MNMFASRRQIAFAIAVLVLVAAGVYGFVQSQPDETALKSGPENVDIEESVRITYEQRIRVTQEAIEARKKTGDIDMSLYMNLASEAYLIGDWDLAAATYKEYLETINSIDYVAWNNYADLLEQRGDLIGAEQAYLKAIELNPTTEYHRDYVDFLGNNFHDTRFEDVREALEVSLADLGQQGWIMISLGRWYLEIGDCTEALNHYKVAAQLEPDNEALQKEIDDTETFCSNR